MKLNTLFIIALSCSRLSYGQCTATLTAKYDASVKKITNLNHKGTWDKDFIVKISNTNSALHKVIVKFNDFYWSSDLPEQLKTVFPNLESTDFRAIPSTYSYTDAIAYLKDASNAVDSFKIQAAKLDSSAICKLATDLLGNVKSIEEHLSYFMGYYENYLEMVKSSKSFSLSKVDSLAKLKHTYDGLKENSTNLILGGKIITKIAQKGLSKSFTSSGHHFTSSATTISIYILDNFNPKDTLAKFEEDIYKKGKFSIDFSTGPGLNYLVKPQYYIGDDNGVKFIGTEKKRPVDFGVMALVHLNLKLMPGFSTGLATGISVSAFDGNTGYLAGAGFSFGKKRTLSLTCGVIIGKTVALSKKISSDGVTVDKTLATDISAVPTYDKIDRKFFFGVTYNLTRKKKTD
ncbi:MAG: hypothetical protein JNM51_16230 [Bacteroidia bacterium]|nr:hypothetical protein [Bacteroidia bacterium]